jgi:hypothetical protein
MKAGEESEANSQLMDTLPCELDDQHIKYKVVHVIVCIVKQLPAANTTVKDTCKYLFKISRASKTVT